MQGEKPQLLQNPVCVPAEARHQASGRVVPSPSGTAYPYIVCFLSLLVRGQKNSTTYFKIYARKHTEVCRETELASPEIQLPHSWLEVDDKLHTPSFQAHRVKNALNSHSPMQRAAKSRRNVDTSGGDQVCSGTHFWHAGPSGLRSIVVLLHAQGISDPQLSHPTITRTVSLLWGITLLDYIICL